jgi:hypothetical protein
LRKGGKIKIPEANAGNGSVKHSSLNNGQKSKTALMHCRKQYNYKVREVRANETMQSLVEWNFSIDIEAANPVLFNEP